jgi:hypothetical protein
VASELQRVASGLVGCLDEIPQVIADLHQTAHRCRHSATAVAQLSAGAPRGRDIALLLDQAARACEEAANRCAEARETGLAWAAEKVGDGGAPASTRSTASRGQDDRPEVGPGGSDLPSGEELIEERDEKASRLERMRVRVHRVADDGIDAAEEAADIAQHIFDPPPATHTETRSPPAVTEQPRDGIDAGHAASAILVVALVIGELIRWIHRRWKPRKGDRGAGN